MFWIFALCVFCILWLFIIILSLVSIHRVCYPVQEYNDDSDNSINNNYVGIYTNSEKYDLPFFGIEIEKNQIDLIITEDTYKIYIKEGKINNKCINQKLFEYDSRIKKILIDVNIYFNLEYYDNNRLAGRLCGVSSDFTEKK